MLPEQSDAAGAIIRSVPASPSFMLLGSFRYGWDQDTDAACRNRLVTPGPN